MEERRKRGWGGVGETVRTLGALATIISFLEKHGWMAGGAAMIASIGAAAAGAALRVSIPIAVFAFLCALPWLAARVGLVAPETPEARLVRLKRDVDRLISRGEEMLATPSASVTRKQLDRWIVDTRRMLRGLRANARSVEEQGFDQALVTQMWFHKTHHRDSRHPALGHNPHGVLRDALAWLQSLRDRISADMVRLD